jgi:guanine deaminase
MVEMRMTHTFMQRAIELALANVGAGGGPFAAVVVRAGRVVGEGANQVTALNDPTAHAEVVAIRKACTALGTFQLTGCEIYTTCEPCPMCLGAIYWARPARVYYASTKEDAARAGFDDSFIYQQIATAHELRRIPFVPLLREASLVIFDAWKKKSDKVEY